jgi:peptidoglycan/LPS O-acetylase OafA/YrhL
MRQITEIPYRPDIQGIRAIAIVLVVLNHAGIPIFTGGFVGVDVFFVLSGYLITALLIKEYIDQGKIKLFNFFSRRLKRLLPALVIMLTIISFATSFLLPYYQLTQQLRSLNFAATWSSNLFFSLFTIDYFSELQHQDLFLHTWSLGLEEQFYLVWPTLILFSFALVKGCQIKTTWNRQLLTIFSVIFLLSLGLSQYWTITKPLWAFYMMPSRIWQFSLGSLAFAFFQHEKSAPSTKNIFVSTFWSGFLSIIGLSCIFGSAVLFNENMTYPGLWASIPSIGAVLIISSGNLNTDNLINRALAHPLLVWIGDRSYSWYLWHWPILMLGFSLGIQTSFNRTAFLVALSLLIAMFSYRCVERPFWKGRFSQISPDKTFLLSISVVFVLIFGFQHHVNFIYEKTVPESTLVANKARNDLPILYDSDCDAWDENAEVNPCIYGGFNTNKTVVLFGDSVGVQWFSLLPEIFPPNTWRTIVLTKSGCPIVDEDFFYKSIGKIYAVCTEWRNSAIAYLESIHPDIIFLGSATNYNFSQIQWIDGTKRVADRLSKAAKNIIVLPGTYSLSFDGPSCLEREGLSTPDKKKTSHESCSEQALNAQADTVANYLRQATNEFSNVKLLNLNDLVCPNGQCKALNSEGIVVFRDHQHLTNSFVRAQAPVVRERLKTMGLVSFSD